jgi:hypothetical protein
MEGEDLWRVLHSRETSCAEESGRTRTCHRQHAKGSNVSGHGIRIEEGRQASLFTNAGQTVGLPEPVSNDPSGTLFARPEAESLVPGPFHLNWQIEGIQNSIVLSREELLPVPSFQPRAKTKYLCPWHTVSSMGDGKSIPVL